MQNPLILIFDTLAKLPGFKQLREDNYEADVQAVAEKTAEYADRGTVAGLNSANRLMDQFGIDPNKREEFVNFGQKIGQQREVRTHSKFQRL